MSEHTPMPWARESQAQIDHLNGFCTLSTAIRFPGGSFQVNRRIADTPEGYKIGQEHAAFIVTACNSHDAMKEALRQCIERLEGLEEDGLTKVERLALDNAKAAIAIAKAKP